VDSYIEAKYALLLSQALDKNYIDLQSDSIIAPAVRYYENHGTPDERLKTLRPEKESSETFTESGKRKNPSQRKYNLSLKEYINIRMVSIVETSEHAAKSYLSTLAVLQLDSILTGARKVSVKKPNSGESPVLYYRYLQRVK